jgi:RimJ/RimL family protein N-acetyltransferase
MRLAILLGLSLLVGGCAASKPKEPAMAFSPEFQPPGVFETDRVRMEPLGPRHVELDYAAFMGSREHLRRTLHWGSWPRDDMTVEENREDLSRHEAEYEAREAYAYTVLSPDRSACVGCVYFNPESVDEGEEADPRAATMRYWVVEDRIERDLDKHVVRSFLYLVKTRFPIDRVDIPVHDDDKRGQAIMTELGLEEGEPMPNRRVYVWRRGR